MINEFESDSSSEDEVIYQLLLSLGGKGKRGGSKIGRGPNIDRGFKEGHERIFKDYFTESPVFSESSFRRRYRLSKSIMTRVIEKVAEVKPAFFSSQDWKDYGSTKADATGKKGASTLQKVTAAMRILAYGIPFDACAEYCRLSESLSQESLFEFCRAVIKGFGDEYLREPNAEDLERILRQSQERGFPGMLGSLDCMHWTWKNCPTRFKGQYQGQKKVPTVVLEAVATYDLWIWHSFFGTSGANNDINVLDKSHLLDKIYRGEGYLVSFKINGSEYKLPYWLVDGIYPEYECFVKTIRNPISAKHKYFAKQQESVRKDIERAFGVLQARWKILVRPCHYWEVNNMLLIIKCCIILHNMMVEYNRDRNQNVELCLGVMESDETLPIDEARVCPLQRKQSGTNYFDPSFRDPEKHHKLKNDLIEYLWMRKSA